MDSIQHNVIGRRAFTVFQFSERYPCSKSRAYRLIAEGVLTARQDGDRMIIEEGEAERWLRSLPIVPPKQAKAA
jgi:hypothetical protein